MRIVWRACTLRDTISIGKPHDVRGRAKKWWKINFNWIMKAPEHPWKQISEQRQQKLIYCHLRSSYMGKLVRRAKRFALHNNERHRFDYYYCCCRRRRRWHNSWVAIGSFFQRQLRYLCFLWMGSRQSAFHWIRHTHTHSIIIGDVSKLRMRQY